MPLEQDLETSNTYINRLNMLWPLGSDYPQEGDDHIRGIKRALRQTFPNITGPITLTQGQINSGYIAVNSVMLFYMAAPPVGWVRHPMDLERMLRVVRDAYGGATKGGKHPCTYMDKVPPHTHGVSITTGTTGDHYHPVNILSGVQNANHTHSGWTSEGGGHVHQGVQFENWDIKDTTGGYTGPNTGPTMQFGQTADAGNHSHSYTTGGNSVNHQHAVNGNTGWSGGAHQHGVNGNTAANAGAAAWEPYYADVIVCKKV